MLRFDAVFLYRGFQTVNSDRVFEGPPYQEFTPTFGAEMPGAAKVVGLDPAQAALKERSKVNELEDDKEEQKESSADGSASHKAPRLEAVPKVRGEPAPKQPVPQPATPPKQEPQ